MMLMWESYMFLLTVPAKSCFDVLVMKQMQILALSNNSADSQCHYCISQRRVFVISTDCSQRHQYFSSTAAAWSCDGGRFQY